MERLENEYYWVVWWVIFRKINKEYIFLKVGKWIIKEMDKKEYIGVFYLVFFRNTVYIKEVMMMWFIME